MKHLAILTLHFSLLTLHSSAAVPLRWTVETSRAQPATFEAYQGETLTFEAALQSAGKPLELSGIAALYWQTNGMGSAYWETTAAVNSNRLSAVWTPEMDVGARVYNCFIGIPGTVYHAAFQLRLRPSPGATPNALQLPTPLIDFAKVRVLNPPWGSGGGGVDTNAVNAAIDELAFTKVSTHTEIPFSVEWSDMHNGAHFNSGGYFHGWVYFGTGLGIGGHDWSALNRDGGITLQDDLNDKADRATTLLGYGITDATPLSMISATDQTFSNAVSTVAKTVTPPPSPTLRLFDDVRQCYWIGRMVNGVINWEVE